MPTKPPTHCSYPGCPEIVHGDYCPGHERLKKRQYGQDRNKSWQHLYGSRWQKARIWWLSRHPLCAECEKEGRVTVGVLIDHIIPHKGDVGLFWDNENWQSLCRDHHDEKTAKEGAFGKGG